MLKRVENLIFGRAETDLAAARRVFVKRIPKLMAKARLAGMLSMIRPGDVVFDCGANVGAVSRAFAARGADVRAFEPDPETFAALAAAAEAQPLIAPRQAAVGLAAGRAPLHRTADYRTNPKRASHAASLFDVADGGGEVVEVEVVDLIALIEHEIAARGEVTVLKLDIEGAELEILEALAERGLFARIRATLAELHPRIRPEAAGRFAALREAAAAHPEWNLDLDWI